MKGKKTPKKVVREIRTRKGQSGGFIHEHHHANPEAHPMEEHTSPNDAAMAQHMMEIMGGPPAAEAAPPDPNAAASGPPAAGGAAPPAQGM
jgi:hypothetical protein